MPQYFFHVYNGVDGVDHEGAYFSDHEAAKQEALKAAGDYLSDQRHFAWDGSEWLVEVTDAEGTGLFALRLSASDLT